MIIIIMVVALPGPLHCHNQNPANDSDYLILDNDDDHHHYHNPDSDDACYNNSDNDDHHGCGLAGSAEQASDKGFTRL